MSLAPLPSSVCAPPALIRIEGKSLVVPKGIVLPTVCIHTAASDDMVAHEETMCWHSPWLYLTIFTGLLPYFILARVGGKTGLVTVHLTRRARRNQRLWHLANWLVFLGTFICVTAGGITENGAFLMASPFCILAAIVIYFAKVRLLYAKKIDDHYIWLRGISPNAMQTIVARSVTPFTAAKEF